MQIPDGCIQAGVNASDAGLAWNSDGSELTVLTVGNPFGAAAGTKSVIKVGWPAKTQTPEFNNPANQLANPTFGEDGTVYWIEPEGIWAQLEGNPARELIGLDGNRLVDLWWTSHSLLMMAGDGSVSSAPLSGGALTTILPADPAAFLVWGSSDGSMIAVTRRPSGRPLEVDLHRNGVTTATILPTNSSTLEWAVRDATALVVLDPTRGLVRQELGTSGRGAPIAPNLSYDFWALSQPTVGGRIAYTGRDMSSSVECFSDALKPDDLP